MIEIFLLLINLFLISKSDIINTMSVGSVLIMCVVGFWTYFHLALAHGDKTSLAASVSRENESQRRELEERNAPRHFETLEVPSSGRPIDAITA